MYIRRKREQEKGGKREREIIRDRNRVRVLKRAIYREREKMNMILNGPGAL